jgi:hypothetical protein
VRGNYVRPHETELRKAPRERLPLQERRRARTVRVADDDVSGLALTVDVGDVEDLGPVRRARSQNAAPFAEDHVVSEPTSAPVTFDHAKTTCPTTVTQKLLPSAAMVCEPPPAIGTAES